MIYGVTILLNDVDFKQKKNENKVVTRFSYEAFFTSKAAATKFYLSHVQEFKEQSKISYKKYDVRGRCEMYKASVQDGYILNNGITIYKEFI